ncbi:GTP 3',8-cyclase MoaA [Campylobacter sp. FMV-PI01]|uniref:GTP 3',8-cyclase n=1 Tax=Campylobacter portucalensis TaxID=2608384 RepID=A0A6L5WG42_9BACT|nr:GTP 3',8-cyclase MoaA [Campylobacter portucalensis]MSN95706.1 GTP 3',8-cyclase MoaA [Campylobacter portucalensis]
MLIDGHGRVVDYLRVSVTQRCNFRCKYCMPHTPFDWVPHENILKFEEMFEFIKVAIDEGVKKIRITGGEPLVRKDVDKFIKMISDYAPEIDLAMTTNGYFLKNYALILKQAGLKRINISLDTLDPKKAHFLAQKSVLHNVLEGFEAAIEANLIVKINTVALKGVNDNELISLLEFAKAHNSTIRFIEYMENIHANDELKSLKRDEILEIISQKYSIKEVGKVKNSPSTMYSIEDGYQFGIIDPHKHDFCDTCNRIRLSAEGLLIPCLYFDEALSIKDALRQNDIKKATEILREVLRNKPEKNRWENKISEHEISTRAFYQTGG